MRLEFGNEHLSAITFILPDCISGCSCQKGRHLTRIEFPPEHHKFFDSSFDAGFSVLDLKWLPWVGASYAIAPVKTLILGESLYDYSEGKDTKKMRIESCDGLRHRQINHGVLAKEKTRFLRNFERAVFMTSAPTGAQRESLWCGVAFHNLVNRLLTSRKHRPTFEDYLAGWGSVLSIFRMLQVDNCVVYGLERKKVLALRQHLGPGAEIRQENLPAVGNSRPHKFSFAVDGRRINLLFIRHPSAFFNWRDWGVVLRTSDMVSVGLQA